jgi:ferredoxin/flavodoxin
VSTTIYIFSGTGNSLAVARSLAERIAARPVSISRAMAHDVVVPDADAIGLVFPVYHKSIPLIIKRFVEKLRIRDDAYVFAVCTCGDSTGLSIEHLRQLLRSRGAELAAGFGVQMPYNYLTPAPVLHGFFRSFSLREVPIEKQQALLARAKEKVEGIAASVRARESGTFETRCDVLTRLADRFNLPETLAKPVWLRVAGVDEPTKLSFLESRQLMDRAFWSDEACNGCGICGRICPVYNIEMVNGRPAWQQRCEQCFACLQWCPQEAIQFGAKTMGEKRYHHPDVTVADMMLSASQE